MGKKSNAKKLKKEEVEKTAIEMPEKSGLEQPEQKMRQIVIETDGASIKIVKAEVSNLEMQAIFSNLLRKITGN